MKHLKKISILVTIIVFGLVTYVLTAPGVQLVESNPAISHNPAGEDQDNNTEAPEIIGETANPEVITEANLPEDTQGMSAAEIEDVLAELNRLEQVNLEYLSKPGWLHITQRTWDRSLEDSQEDENAPYSTAGMFPPIQIYDSWDLIIDDEGTLGLGGFIVNSDENGNPIQVVVSDAEGNGGNLTLLERELTEFFENDPSANLDIATPTKIRSSIGTTIEWFENARKVNLNPDIKAGYVVNDVGKEYQLRVQTTVMEEPYELQWLSEPLNGFIVFYRIDPVTGNVLEVTDYGIGLSGEIYELSSKVTLVKEIVDVMPVDVQQRYEAALDQYMNLVKEKGE